MSPARNRQSLSLNKSKNRQHVQKIATRQEILRLAQALIAKRDKWYINHESCYRINYRDGEWVVTVDEAPEKDENGTRWSRIGGVLMVLTKSGKLTGYFHGF